MPTTAPRSLLAILLAVAVTLAACSSDDSESADDSSTTTTEAEAPSDPLLVSTSLGDVQGATSEVPDVRNFLAIPYAAAPVGDNAWRRPQPREPWSEPLDATQRGASCPQGDSETSALVEQPPSDPDCLSLSVWSRTDATDLPVMVWFHGGSLTSGSAHNVYYTGDLLADEGVVVVGVNYRLGAAGFLATEEAVTEDDDGATGNYGFLDQQYALEWVQQNIAAFGGDPEAVTIFGESAGGFSVCGHLSAPGSRGLFAQASILSGGGCSRLRPLDSALQQGAEFLTAAGCDDLACLRGLSDEDVLAIPDFNASLVADGVEIVTSAHELALAGELDEIPILIGSNADEATLFTIGDTVPDDAGLVERVGTLVDDPTAILELYPAGDHPDNLERYRAIYTDVIFACPAIGFVEAATHSFAYHYTYVTEQNPLDLGATHGSELALLFGHPEGIIAIDIEVDDTSTALAERMRAAWTDFAKHGNPGDGFEPFGDAGRITLLQPDLEQVDEIRGGRCGDVNRLSGFSVG